MPQGRTPTLYELLTGKPQPQTGAPAPAVPPSTPQQIGQSTIAALVDFFKGATIGGDETSGLARTLGEAASILPMGSIAAKGIKAFHGSPHDFDKFSLSKIGTGEGAQAY